MNRAAVTFAMLLGLAVAAGCTTAEPGNGPATTAGSTGGSAATAGSTDGSASKAESKNGSASTVAETEGQAGYKGIDPEEAMKMIAEKNLQVLDVRTTEEFAEGHIPGAVLIPLSELEDRLKELQADQSHLVVCRSGNRSAAASEILVKNGFSSVYNMEGGMNDWKGDVTK